jgi:hypothetical protein
MNHTAFLFLLCCIPAAGGLMAQDNPADRYLSAVQSRAMIYTGKSPLPYPVHLLGHPFLVFTEGTLYYDGVAYPRTHLLPDAYRGDLVVLTPDRSTEVILEPQLVDSAVFGGRHLFYLRPDRRTGCPAEGYCFRVYEGETCRALERLSWSLYETSKNGVVSGRFGVSRKFYILKDDVYYPVRSKNSVLKAVGAYRKELNAYAKERRLNFRRNTAEAIASLLQYYETLNRRQ